MRGPRDRGVILLDDMDRPRARAPLLLFGFLTAYIVLQFIWWAWLLLSKDRDLFALQQQLVAEGVTPILPVRQPEHALWMVAGEGSVFLVLLLTALWVMLRTVRHELALARQQHDFLLAASHELRTPIAGLKLHLATLQRDDLDMTQRVALTANVTSDVDRLRALTEKILLATRLDELDVTVASEPVDVAAELDRIIREAQVSYGRAHRIKPSISASLTLKTDAVVFRSVAENLLENACKYSALGSEVVVELVSGPGDVELRVCDEGPGVPSAERSRIFEKFFRGGNEETRNTKGVGLGLFIVQRSMRVLGGRIEYRPRSPHGSIFAATFPHR